MTQGLSQLKKDGIALIMDKRILRVMWELGCIPEVKEGRYGHVRKVLVKTKKSQKIGLVSRTCFLRRNISREINILVMDIFIKQFVEDSLFGVYKFDLI